MKYSFEHGERSRRGKKKAAVVNKKTLRRLVGFVLVLVTLLAAFQTGVLAATGDTSASTVEVAAQSEGDASGAQDVQQGEVQQDEILDTSSVAQEYTVTLFVGDDQYLEPIAVQDGKIAQPDALAADKVPEGMAFKGWYTQKEDGEKFDAGRAITEDLKLYAQFEQVQDQEDEAAAMADPPQMEDPTPIRVAVLSGILNARRRIAASNSAVQMVPTMIGRDCFPVCRITVRLRPNPSRTTAHWSTFLETKVIPLLNGSFFFKNRVTIMPIRMEKTGPPTTGTALPKNHAGMAMARQIRMPAVFFAKNCCNVLV